jgi:GYF domain 2
LDKWHLARGEHRAGPYSWAQLVEMARGGQIAPTDLVWQEGAPQWLPASSFAGRLPLPGGAPPPAAPGLLYHLKRALEWNLRAMPVTADEEKLLLTLGVDDDDARRYHVWRRSVLRVVFLGGCVAAILGMVDLALSDTEGMSDLGKSLEGLRVVSLLVLPVMAWLAGRVWSRHKRSRRLFTIGWVVSFATPLLLALVPTHLRYQIAGEGAERLQAEATIRLVGAISYYITLMPAVLALIPGIMRACLRIKVLLPQSILPGWFLVGAAPLWTLLFMVVFVTVNQIAGDAVLIIGVLCVTTAPILYLVHVDTFTKPVTVAGAEEKKLAAVQRQVRLVLGLGVVFVGIWLVTAKIFGRAIIGIDPDESMVRPWSLELFRFPIDYATHSLATTALAADLFMAMNLSVWQHTKAFVASAEAKDYDRRMSEIEEAGGKE